jgi:hypothetical protein
LPQANAVVRALFGLQPCEQTFFTEITLVNAMTSDLQPLFQTLQSLSVWRFESSAVKARRASSRPAPIVALTERQLVGLGVRRGQTLDCLEGSIWLTFDYDRRDIVVEAGQSFVIDSDSPGWIEALSPARIRITSDVESAPMAR